MRFSNVFLSTVLTALSVSAQNATSTTAVVSGTAPLTPAQSSEVACLEACAPNDNTCRTKCIPLGDQTNGIADCITSCPKGNGTAADNLSYQNCVANCNNGAAANPTETSGGAATGTGSPGAATGTGSSGATTGAGSGSTPATTTGGSGSSSTATGSAATTSKSSAAEAVQLGSSLIGAAGLLAALFAL